jgi:hypothetical protein
MRKISEHGFCRLFFLIGLLTALLSSPIFAQTCLTSDEIDPSTRSGIQSTAERYFDMISRGDTATLQQNAIPSLATNFSGIESTIKEAQPNLAGSHATARPPFELKAEGTAPLARAEFLCGIFNASGPTANSAEFVIPNLPPGTYAVEVLDVSGPKSAYTVAFVLQQEGTNWKLGGLFLRPAQIKGHDSKWFFDQANALKSKGANLSAWLYYLEGRELAIAVPFMETQATDKLYQQEANFKPADAPAGNSTSDLIAPGGKTYKLTQIFPLAVGQDFDVVVKYQTPSVADTGAAFQENMAVMKALLVKYPELRTAFDGIVARGAEPSGKDYGTMMPMKDLK